MINSFVVLSENQDAARDRRPEQGHGDDQLDGEVRRNNQGSAANRLIGEVVQSRRRPLLGPSPG